MRTEKEILAEVQALGKFSDLDESGLVTRLITLIAFEWILGACPMSPSERLVEIQSEILEGVGDK